MRMTLSYSLPYCRCCTSQSRKYYITKTSPNSLICRSVYRSFKMLAKRCKIAHSHSRNGILWELKICIHWRTEAAWSFWSVLVLESFMILKF